jgi:hypothetical protein
VCGVHDFSIKDLLTPDPKRVKRHLSAIVNFAKFREERLVIYAELSGKVRWRNAASSLLAYKPVKSETET